MNIEINGQQKDFLNDLLVDITNSSIADETTKAIAQKLLDEINNELNEF